MPWKWAFCAALVSAAACSDSKAIHVPAGTETFTLTFPIVTDGAFKPKRIGEPFGTALGRDIDDAAIQIALQENERLVLIDLSPPDLAARETRFVDTLVAEITLAIAAPPGDTRLISDGPNARLHLAVPESARALFVETTPNGRLFQDQTLANDLRKLITLSLPADEEHCRLSSTARLVPFGDRLVLIDDPDEYVNQINRVEIVDRDRLLAATTPTLYVARRGEPLSTGPEVMNGPSPLINFTTHFPGNEVRIDALALSPIVEADGSRQVLVVLRIEDMGHVEEVKLTPEGLEYVGTATAPDEDMNGVGFDELGNAIAVGGANVVLARARGETRFTSRQRPDNILIGGLQALFRIAEGSGLSAEPHVIGGESQIYLGDALRGMWRTENVRSVLLGKLQVSDVAADDTGTDLWVTGDRIIVQKGPGGSWNEVVPAFPKRFQICLDDDETHPRSADSVVIFGTHALVAPGCGAVLAFRRRDTCPSLITAEGVPVADPEYGIGALDKMGDQVVVAGEKGMILELIH